MLKPNKHLMIGDRFNCWFH